MKYLLSWVALLLLASTQAAAQTVEYIYAPPGDTAGTCISASDDGTATQCYSLVYTPSTTGTLTSYTLGYLGTCTAAGDPFLPIPSTSCIMLDNTENFDGCALIGEFLIQLSGNTGATPVTAGVPIAVHQACFTLPIGEIIMLTPDPTSQLTFSIDPSDGSPAVTDLPAGEMETLTSNADCSESMVCSVAFGIEAGRVVFDTLDNGNIVDGFSLSNSLTTTRMIDVYDEENMNCTVPGGLPDVHIDFQILNTIDINGNGLIDDLAGPTHSIRQTMQGLTGVIPMNTSPETESSTGDVRGYTIDVHFADHIGIIADQLTVDLQGMNSAGEAFESAALVFFDALRNPYAIVTHTGYFGGEADLMGSCGVTITQPSLSSSGSGSVLFQDDDVVDLLMPCVPADGVDGDNDVLMVSPRLHAGLDSAAVITGFRLLVLVEDVATTAILDDGTGTGADDGIRANEMTSTFMTAQSTISGYVVTGCLFQEATTLPLEWGGFGAKINGDQIDLKWSTASEINTQVFDVEWGRDGNFFEKVGAIVAKGKTSRNDYDFAHLLPQIGDNYYRIRQVDTDGQYSYSGIERVRYTKLHQVEIYPNPISVGEVLYVSGLDDDGASIEIYDVAGVQVVGLSLTAPSMNLPILATGVYTIAITDRGDRTIKKLVIL